MPMTYGIRRSRTRFAALALIALVLMGLDTYTETIGKVRPIAGLIVLPIHVVAMVPSLVVEKVAGLPLDFEQLQQDYQILERKSLLLQSKLQRLEAVESENDRLRSLLTATDYIPDEILLAEVVRVSVDPYAHTFLVNRGTADGVFEGQPVLDAHGLLGQVVRPGTFHSTVALITDATQAIPVMDVRSGLQALVYGSGDRTKLELPFLEPTADVREGDLLVTSGLGQRFPKGYPVARIVEVIHSNEESFLRVKVMPRARLDSIYEVLLLWPGKPATNTKGGHQRSRPSG
jgi:rod shape-determining protein MreC